MQKLLFSCLFSASVAFSADLPDKKLTPGDTLDVPLAKLCVVGYPKTVRNVSRSVKKKVLKQYGITHTAPGQYEIDHLISLEIGGSNDIKNLWPQLYVGTVWNAHVKDALENALHKAVCDGTLMLKEAQDAIRTDWIAEYKKQYHTTTPIH